MFWYCWYAYVHYPPRREHVKMEKDFTVLLAPWFPGGVEPSDLHSKVQVRFLKLCWWTPPPSHSPAHFPSGRPATWLQIPGEEEEWRGEETAAKEENLENIEQSQNLNMNHPSGSLWNVFQVKLDGWFIYSGLFWKTYCIQTENNKFFI